MDLENIPRSGPAVAVTRHPCRPDQASALDPILRSIRPDVSVLAGNPDGFAAEVSRSLARGGLVAGLPASQLVLATGGATNFPVIPMHLGRANHWPLTVRAGKAIPASRLVAIADERRRVDYLEWRTRLLASGRGFRARTDLPLARRGEQALAEPIAPAVPPDVLEREVAALNPGRTLAAAGDLAANLAPADEIPAVLAEIGRLREITFRAAGEGTGGISDLDRFDRHYLHLFVWNRKTREIVGAYRLSPVDPSAAPPAPAALYTATLFRYGPEFLHRLGPAIELGRSFIRIEYQRSFAPLLLLWKAIGAYVASSPRYKTLFGPVSISNLYRPLSRELIVLFLDRYASLPGWRELLSPRRPFRHRGQALPAGLDACGFDVDGLSDALSDIEPARWGVPVLLRQYLKLGGKLLGFNLDTDFSRVVDGLILVDLTRTEPRLLERYLGGRQALDFLEYHRENHGT